MNRCIKAAHPFFLTAFFTLSTPFALFVIVSPFICSMPFRHAALAISDLPNFIPVFVSELICARWRAANSSFANVNVILAFIPLYLHTMCLLCQHQPLCSSLHPKLDTNSERSEPRRARSKRARERATEAKRRRGRKQRSCWRPCVVDARCGDENHWREVV